MGASKERVRGFYDTHVEWEWGRLDRHRTEFAVTKRALSEFLPPSASVLDCGGGPGRYSLFLASRGHRVTLLDLSAENLALARAKALEQGLELCGYVHASATDLGMFGNATFDAVLLMGPLYHLLLEDDRARCLAEARRVLKPNGLLFATFITRYAAFRDLAKNDPERLVQDGRIAKALFEEGVVTFEGQDDPPFTDFYTVRPVEVAPMMEKAGFETLSLLAQEGLVSMLEEKVNLLEGEAWQAWVDLNYRCASDPSIHGAAEHLLYIGRLM